MAYTPRDTPLARKRRANRKAKDEAVIRDIHDDPIRSMVVYAESGRVQGIVTPQDDGTWSGCRYGPGYPDNTVRTSIEHEAIDYVLDGEKLGDEPKPHPAVEQTWREQEEESDRYTAKLAARAAKRRAAKQKP